MTVYKRALFPLLLLVLALQHGSSVRAGEPAMPQPVPQLRTLPFLFEDTADGPVARTRGLTTVVRDDGVEITAGPDVVRLEFRGAAAASLRMESPQRARVNYLKGPRAAWRTNIQTFGRVRLAGVYPGIDAVFYGTDRQLEYDMEVAAGTSPDPIVVAVHGADDLSVDRDGQLQIAIGDRRVVQRRPIAYQQRNGSREIVDVRYVVTGSEVRFELGPYDRTRPLVIDPIITYSTYFGVEGNDNVSDVAVDSDGTVLIAGGAGAGQLPAASLRPRPAPSGDDPFVARLASDGTPVWLTFLGGTGWDVASQVAVAPEHDVVVAGMTESTDFPVTAGAFDTTANLANGTSGGDAFVARLSPDGADLRYATYLGGTLREWVHALALDGSGRPHLGGATESPDFPVTTGGQGYAQSFRTDGFVTRLSADGRALEMSRLIAGNKADTVAGLALDSIGEINVAGGTTSDIFPVVNAMRSSKFEPGNADGDYGWDGFVMRLTTTGEMRFSTYLGGMNEDHVTSIALGTHGSLYVAGGTRSDNFPGTSAKRPGSGTEDSDIFVVRVADSGMQMLGGRYHGGRYADAAQDLFIDRLGLVWISGFTTSPDFPQVGFLPATPRGRFDIVAAQFSPDLWEVYLSRAFGGSESEQGDALALDGRGDAWFVGHSWSTDYPVVNPVQSSKKSTQSFIRDGVITKLACEVTNGGYTPHRTVGAAGSTGTVTILMDPGCALSPTTTVDWLHVTEIGADRIHYSVDPNPGAVSRTGWIMIEPDWGHRVTQLGTASPQHRSATEIVLNAEDATALVGSWFFDTDPTDEHFIIRQVDRGRPKVARPEIVPAHYFEMDFYAEAGRPYHLWLLGMAERQHWANDSVFVQFSDSVDAAGAAIYRIGTRSSAEINLEDCSGCGVPPGYSWEDNGWGSAGALGPPIRFASTGMHKLWVQTREDGLSVGQIILSAGQYFSRPPAGWVSTPVVTERVLHARDATRLAGAWRFAADTTASRGERLWHPDAGAAKVKAPLAVPRNYTEFTFEADAGRPYRVWVRLKAERSYWGNDSVWLQFSDSVDASGSAIARIGSVRGLDVNLEECSGCGIDGWGWRDDGWGTAPAPPGTPVYFTTSGSHTLRIQTREDGVSVDQVVISADTYLDAAPGAAKRDNTIFE